MRLIIVLITLLYIPFLCNGQMRTITGKVVYEPDFTAIPEVKIQNQEKVVVGKTDINGNFRIEIPNETCELQLSFIGMEWTTIKVPVNCSNLEVLMMVDVIYDYISIHIINKKRYKLFRELPNRHHQAFAKGVFISNSPCFTYIFQEN